MPLQGTRMWCLGGKGEDKMRRKKSEDSRVEERITYIDSNIRQLWPRESMVEVVLAKVVFGQIGDVGGLDMWDVGRLEYADIHLDLSCAALFEHSSSWGSELVKAARGEAGGGVFLGGREEVWFGEKRDVRALTRNAAALA